MVRWISLSLTAALALGLVACGGSGSSKQSANTPTAPGAGSSSLPAATQDAGIVPHGTSMLGMARMVLEPSTGLAELTPIRSAAAKGDAYTVDVTGFFTGNPCVDCMQITGFGRVPDTDDQLRVDLSLTHPFPATDKRRDLDVFDPRIILINATDPLRNSTIFPNTPGTDTDRDGSPESIEGNLNILANADGFTTHFDKRAEEVAGVSLLGNLNPYKNYYTDLFANDPNLFSRNPNHRMSQTSPEETQSFNITFPLGAARLEYFLILEAAWGEASTKDTRLVPTYYLPEFNQKEAFSVSVSDITRSLTSVPGSVTTYEVTVADWQAYGEVNASYPDPVRTDYLPSFSDAEQVWIESIGVANIAFTSSTRISGIGTEADPWKFQVSVTNTAGAPAGRYPALVTVRDSRDSQILSVEGISPSLGYTTDARAYRVVDLVVQTPTTYMADPLRTNLVLASQHGAPLYANTIQPVGDFAVYNDGVGSKGVLIPNYPTGGVARYDLDYSLLQPSYGVGAGPFNDYPGTNPHPDPTGIMPINRIDAADNGSYVVTFTDENFTFNPGALPGSTLTRPLPMSDFAAYYINDNGVLLPAPRFIGGCGSAGSTVSPLFGERMLGVWDNPPSSNSYDHPLGYLSGGEDAERCGDTLDYLALGAPYNSSASAVRQVSGKGNVMFDVPALSWFAAYRSTDAGTKGRDGSQLLYSLVGADVYIVNSREGITANNVAAPSPLSFTKKVILDPINDIGLEAIDLQVLEYSSSILRNFGGIGQINDWVVILYRDQTTGEGMLRIFDAADFSLLLEIDGRSTGDSTMLNYVTAMDVDDFSYEIHVAMDSNGAAAGGSYVVTVYSLL